MSEQQPIEGAAWDAVGLLVTEHRQVQELWGRLQGSAGVIPDNLRLELAQTIIKSLSVHSGIEEQFLYPAVRDALPNGDELADRSLEEHKVVAQHLAHLDGMQPSEPGFEHAFAEMMAEVAKHVAEEEGEIFPALEVALGQVKLAKLAGQMDMASTLAPTRPHPHAPHTRPANLLTGPLTGMVDRVRDAARPKAVEEHAPGPGGRVGPSEPGW